MFLTTYFFNKLCTLFYGAWSWWCDTSNVLFPFTLIVLAIAWYAWIFINNSKKNQPPLPPGPRSLLVVGILTFFDLELHSCFASLSQTYGPIMRLPMGTKVGIVVSSPFATQEMLRDHDITFANREVPELASTAVAKGDLDIVFSPHGPGWQMLRKVCVREVLDSATLDSHWSGFPGYGGGFNGAFGEAQFVRFFLGLAWFDLQGMKKQLLGIGGRQTKDFFTGFDMVLDRTETTFSAIEFAMAKMMNKPEVMKKAQQELETVVGKDGIVEESHINNLPYLPAILKEILRLHPVLSLMVPHCPSQTCIIGADFNYFPFGSGRRMCAGIAMAERMFLFSLGEKLDLSKKFEIVLKKKVPLMAIPTPRLSNPTLYE
ncbi:hypothetical protein CsSME_00044826 [Camellia sinensis var. sinensis]